MATQQRYRIVANRPLRIAYDAETDTHTWVQIGEEVPESRFGSGQALQAAVHTGYVSLIPLAGPAPRLADAVAAGDHVTSEMRGAGKANTRN